VSFKRRRLRLDRTGVDYVTSLLPFVEHLRDTVLSQTPLRRRGLAFLSGASAAAALPPVHFVVVLIPAFCILIWLIEDVGEIRADLPLWRLSRYAFWRAGIMGWWFGLGFFLAGLYWISYSFLVEAEQYAWMIPFAVVGITAVLAIYIGLVAGLARLVAPSGLRLILAFGGLWVGAEWLRGLLFTGFPWNLLGTVWAPWESMLQSAAIGGVYLLSLLTVIAAAMPSLLGRRQSAPSARWRIVAVPFAILFVAGAAGALRLGVTDMPSAIVESVRLRLVQPNIAQKDKWQPDLRRNHIERLLAMSEAEIDTPPPTHVIWPETAVPFLFGGDRGSVSLVARAAPEGGALITGAPRATVRDGRIETLWNSMVVVTRDRGVVSDYDKFHLVPFGEYVPLKAVFDIKKITAGRTDFTPGPGLRSVPVPGAPSVSPLICYEAIFPHHVADPENRPRWLLNLTNDAWFGHSSGPYQHFASARFRAVEEGLPMVRVANTGISGIIDPYGRIVRRSDLGETAAIDGPLPQALENRTFYAVVGNVPVLMLAFFLLLLGTWKRMGM